MTAIKKYTVSKKLKATKTIFVTKTKEQGAKSLFPKKLERVNKLLSKSSLLNS